jgi:hypothetical protein
MQTTLKFIVFYVFSVIGVHFIGCELNSSRTKFKPVVLVHGILTNYSTITDLADRITQVLGYTNLN